MKGPIYASTALSALPADPATVLDAWEQVCGQSEILGPVLDPRLSAVDQAELLPLVRARGYECLALWHPSRGPWGHPAASLCGDDRDERRTAGQQLLDTLQRAGTHDVHQVVLAPVALPLSIQPATLRAAFARGAGEPRSCAERSAQHETARGGEVDGLLKQAGEERTARAGRARDSVCLVLDPALQQAEGVGCELLLMMPTPWPWQFPNMGEVMWLLQEFAGAPLSGCFALDWWHVRRQLEPDRDVDPPAIQDVAQLRVADACGLSTRLPPGTGELTHDAPLADCNAPLVLTLGSNLRVRKEEVDAAVVWLRGG